METPLPVYHVFLSSFGELAMLYQKEPFQLKEVFLPGNPSPAIIRLQERNFPKDVNPSPAAASISRMIAGYFEGRPIIIPWEYLDLSEMTLLETAVLKATAEIPYGEVRSYGDIARSIDKERASRFVGNTLAKNPFPILIPCHRVIRSDQTLGGFGGGNELKKKMIDLEKKHKNRYQRDVK